MDLVIQLWIVKRFPKKPELAIDRRKLSTCAVVGLVMFLEAKMKSVIS